MDSLTPAEKVPLHEVALLMHEIYLVLARMRYLDYNWIHPGPHDLSQLLPTISSLNIDPRILYLYSILPYVTPTDRSHSDFFQGGQFADFRNEWDVKDARDPYGDGKLRPWMTALCHQGNHDTRIFYNARTHRIALIWTENGQTRDHVLVELDEYRREWEIRRKRAMERFELVRKEGEEFEPNVEEEGPDLDCHPDEVPFEDRENWDADGENLFDMFPSRRAGHVLRDIVRWHFELKEFPGRGEHTDHEWDEEYVPDIYRKHGWPSNFDDEGFVREMMYWRH